MQRVEDKFGQILTKVNTCTVLIYLLHMLLKVQPGTFCVKLLVFSQSNGAIS